MKKSEKKVRAYFNKMGWDFDKKKPKGTGIKWEDIGETIGLSADAARLAHSRHRLSLVDEVGYIEDLPIIKKTRSHPHQGIHLVMGCLHIPFVNQKILNNIYQLMSNVKFDGIHLIGDILDLNTLSSHDRGRFTAVPDLTLDLEYEAGNKVLDNFDNLLKDGALKTYIYGNHENRWNRYMADMQAAKTPLKSPQEALGLDKRGYTTMTNWSEDYFTLGQHLELLHGTYFNVHTSKKHIDTLRGSVMFAHTHRIQTYIEGDTGGFNIGWLGNKNSAAFGYASRAQKAQWQNGFAVVTIDENGDYFVEQIIVCNDKFVYGGKVYD